MGGLDPGGRGLRGGGGLTLLLANVTPKHIWRRRSHKKICITKADTWLNLLHVNECHSARKTQSNKCVANFVSTIKPASICDRPFSQRSIQCEQLTHTLNMTLRHT